MSSPKGNKKTTPTRVKSKPKHNKPAKVLVLGGGISGYTLAHSIQHSLRKRGHKSIDITLVDRNLEPGGWIHTSHAPHTIELGPRSLLVRPGKAGSVDDRVRWVLQSTNIVKDAILPSKAANAKFVYRGTFDPVTDPRPILRNLKPLIQFIRGSSGSQVNDVFIDAQNSRIEQQIRQLVDKNHSNKHLKSINPSIPTSGAPLSDGLLQTIVQSDSEALDTNHEQSRRSLSDHIPPKNLHTRLLPSTVLPQQRGFEDDDETSVDIQHQIYTKKETLTHMDSLKRGRYLIDSITTDPLASSKADRKNTLPSGVEVNPLFEFVKHKSSRYRVYDKNQLESGQDIIRNKTRDAAVFGYIPDIDGIVKRPSPTHSIDSAQFANELHHFRNTLLKRAVQAVHMDTTATTSLPSEIIQDKTIDDETKAHAQRTLHHLHIAGGLLASKNQPKTFTSVEAEGAIEHATSIHRPLFPSPIMPFKETDLPSLSLPASYSLSHHITTPESSRLISSNASNGDKMPDQTPSRQTTSEAMTKRPEIDIYMKFQQSQKLQPTRHPLLAFNYDVTYRLYQHSKDLLQKEPIDESQQPDSLSLIYSTNANQKPPSLENHPVYGYSFLEDLPSLNEKSRTTAPHQSESDPSTTPRVGFDQSEFQNQTNQAISADLTRRMQTPLESAVNKMITTSAFNPKEESPVSIPLYDPVDTPNKHSNDSDPDIERKTVLNVPLQHASSAFSRVLLRNGRVLEQFGNPDHSIGVHIEQTISTDFMAELVDPMVAGIYGGNPYKLSRTASFPDLDEAKSARLWPRIFPGAGTFYDTKTKKWTSPQPKGRLLDLMSEPTQVHPFFLIPESPQGYIRLPRAFRRLNEIHRQKLKTFSFQDGMQHLPLHLQRVITSNYNRFFIRESEDPAKLLQLGSSFRPTLEKKSHQDGEDNANGIEFGTVTTRVLHGVEAVYMRPNNGSVTIVPADEMGSNGQNSNVSGADASKTSTAQANQHKPSSSTSSTQYKHDTYGDVIDVYDSFEVTSTHHDTIRSSEAHLNPHSKLRHEFVNHKLYIDEFDDDRPITVGLAQSKRPPNPDDLIISTTIPDDDGVSKDAAHQHPRRFKKHNEIQHHAFDFVISCIDAEKLADILDHPLSHIHDDIFYRDLVTLKPTKISPPPHSTLAEQSKQTELQVKIINDTNYQKVLSDIVINTSLSTNDKHDHTKDHPLAKPDIGYNEIPVDATIPIQRHHVIKTLQNALLKDHTTAMDALLPDDHTLSQVEKALSDLSLNKHAQKHLNSLYNINAVIHTLLSGAYLPQRRAELMKDLTNIYLSRISPYIPSVFNPFVYYKPSTQLKSPPTVVQHLSDSFDKVIASVRLDRKQQARPSGEELKVKANRIKSFARTLFPLTEHPRNKRVVCKCGYFNDELPLDNGVDLSSFCNVTHEAPLPSSYLKPNPPSSSSPRSSPSDSIFPDNHHSRHMLTFLQKVIDRSALANNSYGSDDSQQHHHTRQALDAARSILVLPRVLHERLLNEQRHINYLDHLLFHVQQKMATKIDTILRFYSPSTHQAGSLKDGSVKKVQKTSTIYNEQLSPIADQLLQALESKQKQLERLQTQHNDAQRSIQESNEKRQFIEFIAAQWGDVPIEFAYNNMITTPSSLTVRKLLDQKLQTLSYEATSSTAQQTQYMHDLRKQIADTSELTHLLGQLSDQMEGFINNPQTENREQVARIQTLIIQLKTEQDASQLHDHQRPIKQGSEAHGRRPDDEYSSHKLPLLGNPTLSSISAALRSTELASMTLFSVVYDDETKSVAPDIKGFGALVPTYMHMQEFYDSLYEQTKSKSSTMPSASSHPRLYGLLGVCFDSDTFPELYNQDRFGISHSVKEKESIEFSKAVTTTSSKKTVQFQWSKPNEDNPMDTMAPSLKNIYKYEGQSRIRRMLSSLFTSQSTDIKTPGQPQKKTLTFMAGGDRFPDFLENSQTDNVEALYNWCAILFKQHFSKDVKTLNQGIQYHSYDTPIHVPKPSYIRITKQFHAIPQPLVGTHVLNTTIQNDINFHFGYSLRTTQGDHATIFGEHNTVTGLNNTSLTRNISNSPLSGQGVAFPVLTVAGTASNNPAVRSLMANSVNIGVQFGRHIDY